MTEPSFLEARGLPKPQVKPHSGPKMAKRLVEGYGCLVFPLQRGAKKPLDGSRGFRDAKADTSSIVTNYGVWTGGSGIVAVDLDDYVTDNQCDEFVAEYNLPSTFTVQTGSGGRSLWYRAPEGIELTQRLGLWVGVDIKAGGSYVLGPGNELASSAIKPGATGDGKYSFVKESPTEFAPLPQKLVDALLAAAPQRAAEDAPHEAYDDMPSDLRSEIDGYVDGSVEAILKGLEPLHSLGEGERLPNNKGWETTAWDAAGSLAQLIKADWTALEMDDVRDRWIQALPISDPEWFKHARGMLPRSIGNPNYGARPIPERFTEEGDWFDRALRKATLVDFRQADGGEAEPSAEVVEVDERPDDWPKEAWNEEGHVERTKRWAAGTLRWLTDENIWVRYNGVHWERDLKAGAKAARSALKVARWTEQENYDDTPKIDEKSGQPKPDSSERAKFVKRLSDDSTDRMFNSVARVLATERDVEAESTDFDQEEMLLGVANGTVDLRTGELIPGTPDQMISMACPVEYDPEATAPRFHEYLEESIPSEDVRLYLQRAVGYSISGSTVEQAMFMHYGETTNNGKSVLMYLIERMTGEYSGVADPKALIESRNDQHTTHIAGLAGPRVLMMSETARGARLSDVLVKQITGGDRIKARKIAQDGQNYRIVGKIHMATNHLPHIVASKSTNRRIHVVPWPVQIDNDKIDLELREKLAATELPGILNWAIEGARLWYAEMQASQGRKDGERPSGLGMPVEVRQATDKYLGDEDQIAQWMDERTQASEALETASNLYRDYKWWVEARGERPMTQTAFSLDLKKHDIEHVRTSKARGFRLGLLPLQQNPASSNGFFG